MSCSFNWNRLLVTKEFFFTSVFISFLVPSLMTNNTAKILNKS